MRGRARAALLEAAAACIRERGYAATTQAEVVSRSGANPRSVTYHFGSFDRLRAEALIEIFRERTAPVSGAVTVGAFPVFFAAALAAATADPSVALALPEALAHARDPELRQLFAEHYADVRGRMSAAIAEAVGDDLRRRGGAPPVHAPAQRALFDGLVLQWLVDPGALPDVRAILDSLYAGFGAADRD
jgi:AcrR family transcriptional regulator